TGLGLRFVLAEPLLGLLLGFAFGFFFVAAPIFLLALARLGSFALGALATLAVGATTRLLLGDAALLGLTQPRIVERVGAAIKFLVAERAKHDARRFCRRRRGGRRSRCGRRRSLAGGPARANACARLGRLHLHFGGAERAPLDLLDHDGLGPAVAEALPHDALLDAALERQRLRGRHAERLFTRVLRLTHS